MTQFGQWFVNNDYTPVVLYSVMDKVIVLHYSVYHCSSLWYNAFNVYCRELAPGTVSLTGYRAQGDDGKHCAYCKIDKQVEIRKTPDDT